MRLLSKCTSNTGSHRASPISLGSLFQCLSTLTVQKCLIMPSLTLPWYSFVLLPGAEPSTYLPLHPLLRELQRQMRSHLGLLHAGQPRCPQFLLPGHDSTVEIMWIVLTFSICMIPVKRCKDPYKATKACYDSKGP